MNTHFISAAQQENSETGRLRIWTHRRGRAIPIEDAQVEISYTGDPDQTIEEVRTDSQGQTETLSVPAPPLSYSQTPGENQPYSEYTIRVTASGFHPVVVSGTNVFPEETALQEVEMEPENPQEEENAIVIPANTLFGSYPPKIAETEIKPVSESGEIVLNRVVIPEYVVVHDGPPRDASARDYYVKYRDYIKNVASSEIYSTWPRATIEANVLAIMSFTLNRVYTEWYRNQGYNFTITSSTAYDHKWVNGRNVFENISQIVDDIFNLYLSRPSVRQPILTQYCDGKQVQCPNWMQQWNSKYLGDQGYDAIRILRSFYGDSLYINAAEEVSGVPASWPGYLLEIGSSGADVEKIQEQLNRIAQNYPLIPQILVDGIYGERTQNAVEVFQSIFNLPQTGDVGFSTWYKIQEIYVAVTRIAELY